MTPFDRICLLIKENNTSGAKMAKDLGFSSGLFSQWKSGKQQISQKKLEKIADYFSVTVDDLLGRTPPISYAPTLSDTEQELIELFRSLTPEQAEMLLLTARTAAAQNDRKAAQKEDV